MTGLKPTLRTIVVAIVLVLLSLAANVNAQDFPSNLATRIPDAYQRLLSDDARERVSLLDVLVVEVRGSCTGALNLPFDLTRDDYRFVISKILEKDLSSLDEQTLAAAVHRIGHLVQKFGLREFAVPIARYLAHDSWRAQAEALSILRALRATELDSEIAELLTTGKSKYVRDEALNVLVGLRSKKAVPSLVSLLSSPDHLQRYSAIRRLVEIDGREAAPQIAKLLRDEDANVRYWSLDALVKLNARESAPQIWFLTTGQTEQTMSYAIAALVYFEDPKGVELALQEIKDRTEIGGHALEKIKELNAKAITPGLIRLLQDPQTKASPVFGRTDIVYALGKLDAKESAPVLRGFMHAYPRSLVVPIQVLGDFRDRDSIDDLLAVFFAFLPKPPDAITNDTSNSGEAGLALAKIGDPRTFKVLIDASANPHYAYGTDIIRELNKHIAPDLWNRVEAAKVSGKDFASIKENAEVFSAETKIPIALEYDPYKHYFRFQEPGKYPQLRVVPDQPLRTGLIDIVYAIDSGTRPNRFTYIMDDGRVRILLIEEAVRWWRTKFLQEQSKK